MQSCAAGNANRGSDNESPTASIRFEEHEGALVIDGEVMPRASRAKVGPAVGDRLRVAVTSPPVER
jgi:hypothetical protein